MSAVMPSQYEGEFNPTTDGVEIVPKIWVGTVVELGTKVMRRFPKIAQSRRRPLLGPSPG